MTYHHTDSIEKAPVQSIRKYWPLIVFIFALGGLYARMTAVDAKNQEDIKKLDTAQVLLQGNVNVVTSSQNTIMVQLSQIQTDIQWIKKNINK